VVEGARLESVYTGNRIVGSNPTLTASTIAPRTMRKTKPSSRSGRRRSEAITAQDVARHAGVSTMTVSRVVAGAQNVGLDTRERVLAAVRTLNYAPNTAARSLASATPVRAGLLYSNPSSAYLSALLIGALDEMGRRGSQLIIVQCEPGDAKRERRAVRQLLAGQLTGILLPPPLCESAAVLSEIAATGAVAVGIATGRPSKKISCVRIDDRKAAFEMTARLLALGHKRIGFITGHPNQSASAERLAGFEDAIKAAGANVRISIAQGYFSYQSGLEAAERLLARKDHPTAIFASNDDMAAAAISVAHRRGLKTPDDVSIAGFDDTAIATTVWPELATIRQPIAEMAARAVDLMYEELSIRKNGADAEPQDIVMKHQLIERGSAARSRL
jgi:LacI family transcriptional regulator